MGSYAETVFFVFYVVVTILYTCILQSMIAQVILENLFHLKTRDFILRRRILRAVLPCSFWVRNLSRSLLGICTVFVGAVVPILVLCAFEMLPVRSFILQWIVCALVVIVLIALQIIRLRQALGRTAADTQSSQPPPKIGILPGLRKAIGTILQLTVRSLVYVHEEARDCADQGREGLLDALDGRLAAKRWGRKVLLQRLHLRPKHCENHKTDRDCLGLLVDQGHLGTLLKLLG